METETETRNIEIYAAWIEQLSKSTPMEMRQLIATEIKANMKDFAAEVLFNAKHATQVKLDELAVNTTLAIIKTIDPYLPPITQD